VPPDTHVTEVPDEEESLFPQSFEFVSEVAGGSGRAKAKFIQKDGPNKRNVARITGRMDVK